MRSEWYSVHMLTEKMQMLGYLVKEVDLLPSAPPKARSRPPSRSPPRHARCGCGFCLLEHECAGENRDWRIQVQVGFGPRSEIRLRLRQSSRIVRF
jgi:hypothetical protein